MATESRPAARARRLYGAHPAHLALLVAGFVVVVLAARPFLADQRVPVIRWFVGSAVIHDAVALPAYIGIDAALVALWRRRPGRVSWLNFVRVPAAISALLLVIWYPIIASRADSFGRATGRSTDSYLPHWWFVTAVLFGVSTAGYLARIATAMIRR